MTVPAGVESPDSKVRVKMGGLTYSGAQKKFFCPYCGGTLTTYQYFPVSCSYKIICMSCMKRADAYDPRVADVS